MCVYDAEQSNTVSTHTTSCTHPTYGTHTYRYPYPPLTQEGTLSGIEPYPVSPNFSSSLYPLQRALVGMVARWACLPESLTPRVECWEWHSSHNWMTKLKLEMLPLQTSANTVTFQTDRDTVNSWQGTNSTQQGGLTLQVPTGGDTGTHTH